MGSLAVRSVRRLIAAIVARSSGLRTLLVVTPVLLLGGALSVYGLAMTYLSLYRLLGFVAFSPFILVGALLILLGLATAVALRRADRTVGGFFGQHGRGSGGPS